MIEVRADKKPAVEIERVGAMALISLRILVSEDQDEEQRPVITYELHQFKDIYADDLRQHVEADFDSLVAACTQTEARTEARADETRLNPAKVLEQQNIDTMLATTELYEMLLGG